MGNKMQKIFLMLLLISYNCSYVYAYEFKDSKNVGDVNRTINEIYDLKEQYEILAGEATIVESNYTSVATDTGYWWPIGSTETTEVNGKIFAKGVPENVIINYGYALVDAYHPTGHEAIDLKGTLGVTNVIATRSGVVIGVQDGMKDDNNAAASQRGELINAANYVIIQHNDGTITRYWHLAKGVLVQKGESVEQGQVIGRVGSSGYSTGPHLDFSIVNQQGERVNPLDYIDPENPRPNTGSTSGDFVKFLNSWEGSTGLVGDSYKVVNIGDGVRTVGSGITLENNTQRFAAYGIDIDDYPVGTTISKNIVDQIQIEIIEETRNNMEVTLAKNSIILSQNELEALISRKYNVGNYNGFVNAYKKYGNTQALYDNWFFNVKQGTKFTKGLTRRRNAEWALFHTGEYVYNGQVIK